MKVKRGTGWIEVEERERVAEENLSAGFHPFCSSAASNGSQQGIVLSKTYFSEGTESNPPF